MAFRRKVNTMIRRWDTPGIPHKGWHCIHVADLCDEQGEDYTPFVCEMCGKENLRFVHTICHPDYPRKLKVGCICAGKMESDYEAPKQRERRLVNLAGRRSRWLKREWKLSANGNHWLRIQEHRVVILRDKYRSERWRYLIVDPLDEEHYGGSSYATQDAAKLAAFDELASLLDW